MRRSYGFAKVLFAAVVLCIFTINIPVPKAYSDTLEETCERLKKSKLWNRQSGENQKKWQDRCKPLIGASKVGAKIPKIYKIFDEITEGAVIKHIKKFVSEAPELLTKLPKVVWASIVALPTLFSFCRRKSI